jgi:hypothetical protein
MSRCWLVAAGVVAFIWGAAPALAQGVPPAPCGVSIPDTPECWQAYGYMTNIYRACSRYRGAALEACANQKTAEVLARIEQARQLQQAQAARERFLRGLAQGLRGWGEAWEPAVRDPAPHSCQGLNTGGVVSMHCW